MFIASEHAQNAKSRSDAEAVAKYEVSLEDKYMSIMQKLQFGKNRRLNDTFICKNII